MKNNNQIFVRISFTWEDYCEGINQILIPYDESLKDDISQIKDFFAKEWIIFIKNDRSEWILHRPENDGPAIEYADGSKYYYLNDLRHRENGPAVECSNGDKQYYLNGLWHRINGPAVEYADGEKYYCLNGEYHRKNGPAIVWSSGGKEYFLNGKLHREDGPASICTDGHKEYWLNDKQFKNESEYLKALKELHEK